MPVFAGVRNSLVAVVLAALSLVFAPSAFAEDPWEVDPNDNEGIYILVGTGPPNARVDLVEQGSTWTRPHFFDETLNEGEYTSPTGQFRIDEGFCNPSADCSAGSDEPFQLVFYRGPNWVPIWSSNTMFRAESEEFDLPEVDDVPREDREIIPAPAPTSLPAYTTISGTTQIVREGAPGPAPLEGVSVDAYSAGGRGSDDLYYSGGSSAGRTFSQADGTWTMKVPVGTWALKYRTSFDEPFYPGYVWHNCVIEPNYLPPPPGTPPPSTVTYVNASGPVTGIGLTVGEGGTCNGATAGGPGDGGDPGDGGGSGGDGNPGGAGTSSTGGSSGGGSSGTGGGGSSPAKISAPKATSAPDGTVALTVTVSGPGSLAATAAGKLPGDAGKSAAKQTTIAKGSAKVKKAGTVKLVLKPTAAAKSLLNDGVKLTAKATITFTPAGGTTTSTTKSVTFKKQPPKKRP